MAPTTEMDVDSRKNMLRLDRKRRVIGSPAKIRKEEAQSDLKRQEIHGENINSRASTTRLSPDLCSLDVIGWKEYMNAQSESRRKSKRRQLGETLLRKKTFAAEPNHGELIHRKRESFLSEAYITCTYLGLYDRAVAVDCNGSMTVVKIGDIRDDIRNESSTGKPKPSMRKQETHCLTVDLAEILPINGFSSLFLEPLAEGSMVAVGAKDEMFLSLIHI